MVCTTSCLIASVFLIGMIYSTNATHKSEIVKRYKAQLPEDLRIRYEKITSERKQIYYHGYIAGLILSSLVDIFECKKTCSYVNIVINLYNPSGKFLDELFLLSSSRQSQTGC